MPGSTAIRSIRTRSSTGSAWPMSAGFHTASCRVASASAWGSPWRSSAGRSWSSSTSRRPGMDPAAKAATRELIASLRDAGVSVLLTTHELADVERLADRIAIVDRGRIVAEGTPAELTAGRRPAPRPARRRAVRWRPGRARSRARRGRSADGTRGPARRRRWGRALPADGGRPEPGAGRGVDVPGAPGAASSSPSCGPADRPSRSATSS